MTFQKNINNMDTIVTISAQEVIEKYGVQNGVRDMIIEYIYNSLINDQKFIDEIKSQIPTVKELVLKAVEKIK